MRGGGGSEGRREGEEERRARKVRDNKSIININYNYYSQSLFSPGPCKVQSFIILPWSM